MFPSQFEHVARQLHERYAPTLASERNEKGGLILYDNTTYTECGIGDGHGRIDYSSCPLHEQESVVTWHTHPTRSFKYEPPSGFDLASAFDISVQFKKDVQGLAVETKGVWYYRVNYNTLRTSKQHLEFVEWLGNARATQLLFASEAMIDFYDVEDIQQYQLTPAFLTIEEYTQRLSQDTKGEIDIQFLHLSLPKRTPILYTA